MTGLCCPEVALCEAHIELARETGPPASVVEELNTLVGICRDRVERMNKKAAVGAASPGEVARCRIDLLHAEARVAREQSNLNSNQ